MDDATQDLIQLVKIGDLIEDEENANLGTDRGQILLRESLSELGAGRSILLDKDGRIIAGNKTKKMAEATGMQDVIIVRTNGKQIVAVQRIDLDLKSEDGKDRRLANADNRIAEIDLQWDASRLAAMRLNQPEAVSGLWTEEEIEEIISAAQERGENIGGDDDEEEPSDGSLLGLVDVSIAEPRNKVMRGDIWMLGNLHVLICADVMTEWELWKPFLQTPGCLFCPYPGAFVPLSRVAAVKTLIMVQPDIYIAGHILDRYEDVNGANSIRKAESYHV